MKLALVYHQFIARGGLEGYLMEFARRLKAAGHELELVTCRVEDEMRALAGRVHLIPPGWTNSGTLQRFARESEELVPRLEVDAVLGFGRTWRQDIHRAGGGCHARYSAMLPWWRRAQLKNLRELALERRLYTGGQTRGFVVNSAKAGTELQEHYAVPRERIRVIHTAVDTEHFAPAADRTALRTSMGLRDDDRVLLFVSLDHQRKGLPLLIEALRGLRRTHLHLWVAGAPLGRQDSALHGLARVQELSRLRDLRPYYQAADLFIHPTQYDACANTVLQSMACGLPGLISTGDGAAEFISDGVNGWRIDPNNAAALAERITSALPAAAGLAAAARETMLPLTWDAHLAQWMEWVKECSPSAPRSHGG
jgi:glycosyltransferase involved in cell wall biosynthesis